MDTVHWEKLVEHYPGKYQLNQSLWLREETLAAQKRICFVPQNGGEEHLRTDGSRWLVDSKHGRGWRGIADNRKQCTKCAK